MLRQLGRHSVDSNMYGTEEAEICCMRSAAARSGVYEATGPEAVCQHALLAELRLEEIIRVADMVIVSPGSQA